MSDRYKQMETELEGLKNQQEVNNNADTEKCKQEFHVLRKSNSEIKLKRL